MCLNATGLDYLRRQLPDCIADFNKLDRCTVLSLMKVGLSTTEIAFYAGKSKEEVNEMIDIQALQ